jgi:tagaturonate reductase
MHLNRQTIGGIAASGKVPVGPLASYPERVIQFGEGNFLRAFIDWMINEMNGKNLFNGRVIVVQPLPDGMIDKLNSQNGLYTLLLRGVQGGKVIEQRQVITSVSRGLNPCTQWKEFLACAEIPDLRYVVSNTTEAGIEYVSTEWPEGRCPKSFPAKLTAFLFRRYGRFAGAGDKGMVILPCELIERNGATLKKIILKHSADWLLEEGFIDWIEGSCKFFDTLVDRIVPGYPAEEADALAGLLGYDDRLIDAGEIFHLWVLEGDADVSKELPLVDAGLNVLWTSNLQPYRTRKVRILNGAHTMMVPAAFLCGKETVLEAVQDEIIGGFMRRGIFDEIIPTLDLPENEKKDFAAKVIERFQNPFIRHRLLSIALNSVSKFKVRVLPSLTRYVELRNAVPPALAFSLAALIVFYRGTPDGSGKFHGTRNGEPYEINDSPEHLQFFREQWSRNGSDIPVLSRCVLSNRKMWDADLSKIPGLVEKVSSCVGAIIEKGMQPALKEMPH